MNESERLRLAQAGQDLYVQKARDYGKLINTGVTLGADQLAALTELEHRGPWTPRTEHIRRAVDLYLASIAPSDASRYTPTTTDEAN